ncbi:MAG: hypothetical protein JW829_19895 [Pirellulales bacterium]|nr:hypothetical protein [Pirellulales bacterium]
MSWQSMELIKSDDRENPICPHCEKELHQIVAKQFDKGWFKVTEKYVYYCPYCKKILGIGQSAWA